MRYNNWKMHFQVKNDWFAGVLIRPTIPRPVNLRVDPLEQHMDAPPYPIYAGEKLWTVLPAAARPTTRAPGRNAHPPRPPSSSHRPGGSTSLTPITGGPTCPAPTGASHKGLAARWRTSRST